MAGPGGKPRILIVGAGIAGLALAASLKRAGITTTVVEVEKASMSRGLALMLTSNVALALRRLGLDRPVIDHGIVLERARPDIKPPATARVGHAAPVLRNR